MFAPLSFRRPLQLALALLLVPAAFGQTFNGTNAAGNSQNFSVSVSAPQTGLSVATTNNNGSAYSSIYLESGGTASSSNFDWASTLAGAVQNEIHLERPELVTGSYGLNVETPIGSGTHNFSVTATANPAGLRTAAKPVSKAVTSSATGALTAGNYHYFRVDLPSGLPGWRAVLTATGGGTPDLYISRGAIPTISSFERGSTGQAVDTIFYDPTGINPGSYFVGIYVPVGVVGTVNYAVNFEASPVNSLTWDPGTTHLGTQASAQPNLLGGDYFFKVTTQNTTVGAWRTALNVTSGTVHVYLRRSSLPSVATDGSVTADFSSVLNASSNGFVVRPDQYNAAEDWFYLVRATSGAQWNLVSGEAFVQDLGTITADGSSGSGNVPMGAEGTRFFRTNSTSGIEAWELYLNGQTPDIVVRTTSVPFENGTHHLRRAGQMLVVPPYLDSGASTYYVAFSGTRGTTYNLDSRIHAITDIAFTSSTAVTGSGYRYRTYRIEVPIQQIAWEPRIAPSSGSASIAIRQNLVPNEDRNDAFSEVGGGATNSIALSPTILTNGTWYVTVYSTANYAATLTSGQPVITDINFTSTSVNDAPTKVGWRYYRLGDINQQLGALGWDLFLQNHVAGTEIALRRNAVPSRQKYRDGDLNPGTLERSGDIDFSSTAGFLQRPGHQADIWYVGIYQPTVALGSFTLQTLPLTAAATTFDGSTTPVSNQPSGKWHYRVVTVPAGVLGWDLRITSVTGGMPRLVVRRDQLPTALNDGNGGAWNSIPSVTTTWPTGNSWAAGPDWTRRRYSNAGADEDGRIMVMPTGRPLQPGTYYVGIINDAAEPGAMTYSLVSRGIGTGQSIAVSNLAFSGGSTSTGALAPRQAAYYKVSIPLATPSWRVRLTPTAGEAMLNINRGVLPTAVTGLSSNTLFADADGLRISQPGADQFLILPQDGQTEIPAGDYYLAVASEGTSPVDASGGNSRIGTGTSTATITSLGSISSTAMGVVGGADLVVNDSLACGEVKTYQFTVPAGLASFELKMENRVGEPFFRVVRTPSLPGNPPFIYSAAAPYSFEPGFQGGSFTSSDSGSTFVSLANPVAGTYSITVRGFAGYDGSNITYPAASYTLRLVNKVPINVNYDGAGSTSTVTNQESSHWQYFRVVVPAGSKGWDLRLVNVTSGQPRMVVRRSLLPTVNGGQDDSFTYVANIDWTRRGATATGEIDGGRLLVLPDGAPLSAGTYFVGVIDPTPGAPMTYTLQSRGIGTGFTIPITNLNFSGGTANITALAPKEVAYYKVTVPAATPNWKVRLTPTLGEAMLVVSKTVLPGVLAHNFDSELTREDGAGVRISTLGTEYFQLLPPEGQTALQPGDYYLGVVSEGQNPVNGVQTPRTGTGTINATLDSLGSPAATNLGTVGVADLTMADALQPGESKVYEFTVPGGISSFELRMENITGVPAYRVGSGNIYPGNPGGGFYAGDDPYVFVTGLSLGQFSNTLASNGITNFSNPTPGVYRITTRSAGSGFGNPPPASYTLRVINRSPLPLAFDGGGSSLGVSNQTGLTWQYFQVTVPAGSLGWELRLVNVSAGSPSLVVRRDALPSALDNNNGGFWDPDHSASWPTGFSWAASDDWSRRPLSSGGVNQTGRYLVMPAGRPLEPGTYFVGVYNRPGDPSNMTYTIQSRGIGSGFTIPVTNLAFSGGSANVSGLAERQVGYYRVTVPPGTLNLKLRLTPTAGEAMLLVNRGALPSSGAGRDNSLLQDFGGVAVTKPGVEFYHLLPVAGQATIPPGDYFIGVGSEGVNPSGQMMGTGTSSATLLSVGSPAPVHLGTVSGTDLVLADSLQCSEAKTYTFTIPAGLSAVDVRLENRVGEPYFRVKAGTGLMGNPESPFEGFGGAFILQPALDLGNGDGVTAGSVVTLSNPTPGTYSLTARAFATLLGASLPDASYTLRVVRRDPTILNFSASQNGNGFSHTDTRSLERDQRAYYRVDVPVNSDGGPVIGWKLAVANSAGSTRVRVSQSFSTFDPPSSYSGIQFSSDDTVTGVVTLPTLNPGSTWFIEVAATNGNPAAYTITSSPVLLRRPAWSMPIFGGMITTPGPLDPGDFGDSGVDVNGNLVAPDRGTDLGAEDYHYYAINVPAGNGGLLRVRLDAISGNSDLFIRPGNVPSITHSEPNSGAPYVTYQLTNTGSTEYGNFVPLSGRTSVELTTGIWYLAVRATGSNARYRLHVSIGSVTTLALNGSTLTNQSVAGGDWRYYRFQVPVDAPASVSFTFAQQLGSAAVYVRDVLPPGEFYTVNNVADWALDFKNQGPYPNYGTPGTYQINTPPLRPGSVYYLGFKATTDCTFSLSATSAGGPIVATPVAFVGGTINVNLPPGGSALYKVTAPADAVRLKYSATKAFGVDLRIEQGSIPQTSGAVHHSNNGTNGGFNVDLYPENWPYVPSQTYYVLLQNPNAGTEPVTVVFNGATFFTDDNDNDGLPDWWERQFFGNDLSFSTATSSPANDGISNLLKYALGLNPLINGNAAIPRPVIESGFLTMTIAKPVGYPVVGITYVVESAGALSNPSPWSSATTTVLIDNGTTLKVRDNTSATPSPGNKRVMRLKVTRP